MSDDNNIFDVAEDLVDVIAEMPSWVFVGVALLIIGIVVICLV